MARSYTVDQLASRGPRYAFALLLQHIRDGDEPFVTYGAIARLLERRFRIPHVFPTHVGSVAGALMDEIETARKDAPPINALITRPNGIPGSGFAYYFDRLWREQGGRHWSKLSRTSKLHVVEEIRAAVRRYAHWDEIYRKLYRADPPHRPRPKTFTERDGKPAETARRPGTGESVEHRRLKEWAVANPDRLGLARAMKGVTEQPLLSGDRIDVLFSDGENFVAIEVKSMLSSEDDWQRGVYQCVKYRAVLQAQERPVPTSVRAILLTERPLTAELKARASELDVALRVVAVNAPG
jgi:hypothetical protein